MLQQASSDPLPLLWEYIKAEHAEEGQVQTKKRKEVQKEAESAMSSKRKKEADASKRSIAYTDVGFTETSLTETWRLINQESGEQFL